MKHHLVNYSRVIFAIYFCYKAFKVKRFSKIYNFKKINDLIDYYGQNQLSRGVLRKRCSEIMQQIFRRTPMPKCDFNNVAKQLASYAISAYKQAFKVHVLPLLMCFEYSQLHDIKKWQRTR